MIHCVLDGGLGNMMFQIAMLESAAKDRGLETNYPNIIQHIRDLNDFKRTDTYKPHEYLHIFKNFKWPGVIEEYDRFRDIPYGYRDLCVKDGGCLKGYFQSERYFKHNREFVLDLFEPNDQIKNVLNTYYMFVDEVKCSIHVRRGDYLKYSDTHPVQNMEYFREAAKKIGDVDVYMIFSDDIGWCLDNFLNDEYFSSKTLFFVIDEKDYVELYLMSMCDHNIISNSSFSWWGAWMNQNENKIVVAPKKWWAGDDKDVVPNEWIKI
jgi:hypothetical protein